MIDQLGDRMKLYENIEAGRRFMPLLPIVARIDGRAFSRFTKGLERPYDQVMSDAMIATCKYLVEHTGATMGYTQSDEITLTWHQDSTKQQVWFAGRVAKMISQLSAQATLAFYREVVKHFPPNYSEKLPTFDARVWQLPNRTEAANVFIWREWDATKNSIQMAARHYYSNKQLHAKNGKQLKDMLLEKGVNWNHYPAFFKRGTYIQRSMPERKFEEHELHLLPPKHAARSNPDLVVVRSVVQICNIPPLTKVTNKEDFLFEGADPIIAVDVDLRDVRPGTARLKELN